MKKLTALTLAILLALSLVQGAAAATYVAGEYYTIDYPDTLTLDDTTYSDEHTEDSRWLFLLYDDDYLIDATLNRVTDYEGESLYNADQAERDAYVADTLAAFADDNIELVREITTVSGFPFYIYSREGTDGVFYYAETIANGTSVNFTAYYADAARPLDNDLLETLTEVLITLRPTE
ncbi:MAG: hypothetical protein VB087_09555 [Candidatus Limiplasma sp.]|nr:hypothetical protein [Candidatus Limiplasma sp.]MEA5146363.1 hypothetical protein [Candidatus Limiplasma sp.]